LLFTGAATFSSTVTVDSVAFIGQVPTYTTANAQFSHKDRAGAGEYSFLSANDGTTFVNAKTGYDINFRINNSNIAIMKSSGSVGIGTTNPLSTLHVSGSDAGFRITGSSRAQMILTNGLSQWQLESPTGVSNVPAGAFGIIESGVGSRLTILTGGDVGIGTTAPLYRLEVQNSTGDDHIAAVGTAPSIQLMSANSGPANWGTVGMATTTNNFLIGAVAGDFAIINRGTTAGNILFGFGSTERMRLISTGQLRLNAYTSSSAFTGTAVATLAVDSSGNVITVTGGGTSSQWVTTGSDIYYNTGRVGIGTIAPVANLHIASNTNTGLRINATASNGSAELDLLSHGTQNAFIDYGPNQLRFRSTNSDMSAIISQSVLVLQNDGSIGIGTTLPTARLEVKAPDTGTTSNYASKNIIANSPLVGGYAGAPIVSMLAMYDGSIHGADIGYLYDASGYGLVFSVNDNTVGNPIEALRINRLGNVGINTTSPTDRLTVVGADNGITISSIAANRPVFQLINGSTTMLKLSANGIYGAIADNTGSDVVFFKDGRVGIGLTNPSYKLHVVGSTDVINATSTSTDARINIGHSANGGYIGYANTGPTSNLFYVTTGSGTIGSGITMDNNGNVGIRTTFSGINTAALLTIKAAVTDGNQIYIVQSNDDRGWRLKARTDGHFYLQSSYLGSDTTNLMIQYDTGRVGIGTASPSINLHVAGTNNSAVGSSTFWNFAFSGAEITNFSNTVGTVAGLALIGGSGRGSVSAIANILESTGAGQLGFFTGGGSTGTVPERMRITSGGQLLINSTTTTGTGGFTNTTVNLKQLADGGAGGGLHIEQNSNTNVAFFGFTGSAFRIGTSYRSTGSYQPIEFSTSGVVALTIANNQAATFSSTVTCTSLTETSTIKVKENIVNVDSALDQVEKLQAVSYNRKGSAVKEIGLIAEAVEEIYPEFVQYDQHGEPIGLHYSRLTAVLIESVKELKKEIDILKQKN
jgi:hypothetical protein